ncbi:glycosyltransferase [Ketobacter sp. MCCC 1A13808]|uniref:glycosyltransferase n=1 Tax=Ketobacter sp. MCCC 1A13808 TaxID=2602738 RepID=UPI0012EB51FC|nr:glycosyltransferase [Ketobacter sp. MCCC 1A13808]MVF13755.1 glycosyltransferase [Ketobacter sp. MCCC 1A13808]
MKRLLYICHDAHFHGAQLLSLSIISTLKQQFGYSVTTVLLNDGELKEEFERCSDVIEYWSLGYREWVKFLADARAKSNVCVSNTVVSGRVINDLKSAGFRVTSLIHELPTLIRSYELGAVAADIGRLSDVVVFPAEYVRDKYLEYFQIEKEIVILPQGLYKKPDRLSTESKLELRARLGIPKGAKVVSGIGFADIRKGVDLFVQVASLVSKSSDLFHFIWVGELHREIREWLIHDINILGVADRVHFVGKQKSVDSFYEISDIMLMTSREDPFPSTVLEAISHGAYVIGFEHAGGAETVLREGCGETVPYLDVAAMANVVLGNECNHDRAQLIEYARQKFDFQGYVLDLLKRAYGGLSITAIVPSYNYQHLIYDRLRSIVEQSFSVDEIIVLDDSSTDNSQVEIQRFVEEYSGPIKIKVDLASDNSGSVFLQWQKGLKMASGDLIWIAEADDVADPSFIENLVPSFSDKDVRLAYCESKQLDSSGQEIAPDYRAYTGEIDANHWKQSFVNDGVNEIKRFMSVKNTIPNVSAVLFRRPDSDCFFSEVNKYRVAGDWVFYLHLLSEGKVAYVADSLNGHRRHDASQTSTLAKDDHFFEISDVQDLIRERFGVSPVIEEKIAGYREFLREYFGLTHLVR